MVSPRNDPKSAAQTSSQPSRGGTPRKSSGPNGNCVELAPLPDGTVAMRNSRDPQGVALVFTRPEFEAFVQGAIAGEFAQFQ